MWGSLSLIIERRPDVTELIAYYCILIITVSIAGQLTLIEAAISLFRVLEALAIFIIDISYSFIYVHKRLAQIHLISPLDMEDRNYSALKIKEHNASEFIRPGAQVRHTERGLNKPAIQCAPIYVDTDKFVNSPTEIEGLTGSPDSPTNKSIRAPEKRGRNEAVIQAARTVQTAYVSSIRPTDSEGQPQCTQAQPVPHKKPYIQACKRNTAPCSSTASHLLDPPEKRNSLLGSLKGVGISHAGPVSSSSTHVHVLGVGLSWEHDAMRFLSGPSHDIHWLKQFFSYQKHTHFTSLLDEQASFNAIHESVASIYMNAQPGDHIVLYFTGHGNKSNSLELYDNPDSLNEIILNRWIIELRQKTPNRPRIPVHIIFDFCRESPNRSNAQLDVDVNIIWSCPPGQKALDMFLSPDLPYSNFLKALLLAIGDGSKSCLPSTQSFALRIMEISNIVWGVKCHQLRSRRRWCRHLQLCKLCRDDKNISNCDNDWPNLRLFEGLDNMYLGSPLDFSTLVRYALTRFPLPIQKVCQTLEANRWFMYFNPSRISTNNGSQRSHKFLPHYDHHVMKTESNMRHMTLPPGLVLTYGTLSTRASQPGPVRP
ncbi:hypothetical protein RHS03_07341, partial [Rhizoctonia solani]